MHLRIFLLLILALNIPAGRPASRGPVTLEEYWALVDHSLAVVAALEGAHSSIIRDQLAELATQWAAVETVALRDGQQVKVDSSYLIAQLSMDEPDLAALNGMLTALKNAREGYRQGVFSDADLEILTPILARPEFQWQKQQPSWLQQLWERFLAWLRALQEQLFGPGQPGEITVGAPVVDVTSVLAVVIFVVLVGLVLRGLLGGLVKETQIDAQSDGGDEPLSAAAALQRAQALSGSGDYRAAVRYLYLSSLLMLEERGLLRYDRTKTNREYLGTVADRPEVARPLQNVVDVFDRVWYGYQPIDPEGYHDYEEDVQRIKEQGQ